MFVGDKCTQIVLSKADFSICGQLPKTNKPFNICSGIKRVLVWHCMLQIAIVVPEHVLKLLVCYWQAVKFAYGLTHVILHDLTERQTQGLRAC